MKRIFSLTLVVLLCLCLLPSCDSTNDHDNETQSYTLPEITSMDPPPSIVIEPDDDSVPEYRYVASSESDKYHRLSCQYVDMIKPYNIVYYYTKDAARKDKKEPCSVCNP